MGIDSVRMDVAGSGLLARCRMPSTFFSFKHDLPLLPFSSPYTYLDHKRLSFHMRARARCHTCSRFIPSPLSLTKILLFPIQRRAACRRRRSIALFTVCRYAHVDKRTQSPHRNAIDFWPLSLFPLFLVCRVSNSRPSTYRPPT